jgi:hypothetical protein
MTMRRHKVLLLKSVAEPSDAQYEEAGASDATDRRPHGLGPSPRNSPRSSSTLQSGWPKRPAPNIEPEVKDGRSYAGFNPANRSDVKLFEAVLDGNHVVRGFRDAEIREARYGTPVDPLELRRQSAAVGHLLKRLHAAD